MKKSSIIFLLGIFIAFVMQAQQVTFQTQAPKVVGVDERFKVSFTVNASNPSNFVAPTFRNVNILSGPNTSRSSSVVITNGHRESTQSTTFTYWLQSLGAGEIYIPAARIIVDGKTYSTQPVKIKVEKDPSLGQRSANNPNYNGRQQYKQEPVKVIDDKAVFVRAIPSKTKVVKGEEIVISYKIYTLVPVSEYQVDKFPSSQGFWVEELDNQSTPTLEREVIDGKVYQVATLRKVLVYPQKSGSLHIDPMGLEVVAHVQTGTRQRQRQLTGDPFFDAFFNDPFFANITPVFERVRKKLKTNALTIQVEELPKTDEVFSGGVGQFEISSEIDTSYSSTNEAITLQYTISGKGNLTLIEGMDLKLPEEFEVYDPNITDKINKTEYGQSGSRTFQYLIIPRVEGVYEVPSVKFTYFDPESREYKTISAPSYKLNIKKGKENSDFSKQLSEREKYRNMDIDDTPENEGSGTSLLKPFNTVGTYVCLFAAIILMITAIKITQKQKERNQDFVSVKLRKANKIATKRLRRAKNYLNDNMTEEFETEIGQALWNYLSDKFKIPTYNLTLEKISTELQNNGLENDVLSETTDALTQCEYIRFSQSKEEKPYKELYDKVEKVITEIESQMTKTKKNKRSGIVVILAVFMLFSCSLAAQNMQQANKHFNNKEYEKALSIYLQLEKSKPSGELYHNIANTYFRLSDYANGMLYYERALKLNPNDKRLMTNCKICNSRLMGEVYVLPDFFLVRWTKTVANIFPPVVWFVIFLVLLVVSCVLFFVYRFNTNRKVMFFYLSMFFYLLTFSSLGLGTFRQNMINGHKYAIVFENKGVKENIENEKKADIKLFKGQKIKILENRNEFIRIRTQDGKEGWIEKETVKII